MNLKKNFYKKILDTEIDSKTKGINEINKIILNEKMKLNGKNTIHI